MSFVHEFNKNNRKDTKCDEFAWHNNILTNRLRFICLFVNVNVRGFTELEKFGESAKTYAMEIIIEIKCDWEFTHFTDSAVAISSPQF